MAVFGVLTICLQKRSDGPIMYNRAWGVSASGYIEEIGVSELLSPLEEYIEFFGLVYLSPPGFLDIVGQCLIASDKFDGWWNEGRVVNVSADVAELRVIPLTSNALAEFLRPEASCAWIIGSARMPMLPKTELFKLQLGPIAAKDSPVFRPAELERLAGLKCQRNKGAASAGLLFSMSGGLPFTREGGH